MAVLFVVAFLFGLATGSFLNVVIHRIPRGESVWIPLRSYCPSCRRTIRARDNVPLLSFLLLGGRCRDCGARIRWRYPLVELLTGTAWAGALLVWGWQPATAVNGLFLSLLVALAFIDYDHQILPDVLTLPGLAAGLCLSWFQDSSFYGDAWTMALAEAAGSGNAERILPLVGAATGALAGSLPLLVIDRLYFLLRRRQGLGLGDVKMMAMVGSFLGWRLALLTIFAGSFLGSLAGVYLILGRGKGMQHRLPFGTLLGAGAALSLFAGLPILLWYLGLL